MAAKALRDVLIVTDEDPPWESGNEALPLILASAPGETGRRSGSATLLASTKSEDAKRFECRPIFSRSLALSRGHSGFRCSSFRLDPAKTRTPMFCWPNQTRVGEASESPRRTVLSRTRISLVRRWTASISADLHGTLAVAVDQVPNSAPTPAVTAMARAPQKVTRNAPTVTPAPPARAASPPRRARNNSDVPRQRESELPAGLRL